VKQKLKIVLQSKWQNRILKTQSESFCGHLLAWVIIQLAEHLRDRGFRKKSRFGGKRVNVDVGGTQEFSIYKSAESKSSCRKKIWKTAFQQMLKIPVLITWMGSRSEWERGESWGRGWMEGGSR
jgi:hypothetical protein